MDDRTVAGRVFAVLDAVGARASIPLAELVAVTGIPKSSAHRIAEDLVCRGVLVRVDEQYSLGPHLRELVDGVPRADGLGSIEEVLTELHTRLGGIAWFAERADELTRQPTLVVATPGLRRIAAAGWQAPDDPVMFAKTAYGHAVLAARWDLAERLLSTGFARRDLHERLSRGADLGAFYDSEAVSGWRCAAVRLSGGVSGIVGVTIPGERIPARDVIRTTRNLASTLST